VFREEGLVSHFVEIAETDSLPFFDLPWELRTASRVRQREFIAGRKAARLALRRLGLSSIAIPISSTGAPHWPAGVCGSISHSRTLACAVVTVSASCASVGVDIEPCSAENKIGELRKNFLTAGEDKRLSDREALVAFSAKESLYKLLHPLTNTYFGFDSAEVTEINDAVLVLTLTTDVASFRRGTAFAIEVVYHCDHVVSVGYLSTRRQALTEPG